MSLPFNPGHFQNDKSVFFKGPVLKHFGVNKMQKACPQDPTVNPNGHLTGVRCAVEGKRCHENNDVKQLGQINAALEGNHTFVEIAGNFFLQRIFFDADARPDKKEDYQGLGKKIDDAGKYQKRHWGHV